MGSPSTRSDAGSNQIGIKAGTAATRGRLDHAKQPAGQVGHGLQHRLGHGDGLASLGQPALLPRLAQPLQGGKLGPIDEP